MLPTAADPCPCCKYNSLVEGEGTLDQCGMTVLPTKTVYCSTVYCEFKAWYPVPEGTPWHSVKRK